jgi:uncharacterized membrane protein YdjX (TVP38/TMEM64 family)
MKRTIFLILGLAAFVVLSKFVLEDWLGLGLVDEARAWVAGAGAGSALAVILLLAIDLLIPVPSSIVMILSGAAFGVVWGSIISLVGSIGGEWLGFELVRRFGRRLSAKLIGDAELARLTGVMARHGAAAVVVTRAVPVLMETMSVVAGLSSMKRSTFLLASLAGTAPIVVVYAYAGAMSRELGSIVPAIIILVAVAASGWVWYRARLEK